MSGKIKELLKQPKYAAAWTLIKTGLALTLVFAVFLNIDKTLGWFSNNTEVEAQGMAVNVAAPEGVVESVEYFKISAISSVISNEQSYNVYEFAATDKANAKLETFSELIALRQIMLKVTLKSDLESARIYATTNTKKYITEGTIAALDNPLSSIVEIRVATEATDATDASGTYKISDANTQVLRFAERKQDGVGFEFDQQTNIVTLDVSDKTPKCIYIIIDYYEESTAYVMDVVNTLLMSNSIELGVDSQVGFTCDFTICIS